MLHYETIESSTLELLIKLQKCSIFNNLRLVGGTALALQIGHRKSVDIDLFGILDADEQEILEVLKLLGDVKLLYKTKNVLVYLINGIKTDIVRYSYEWIEDELIADRLRLADKKDIAAMKLSAITGRGTKKDFIDLAFLLQEFSLKQMLEFYSKKYPDGAEFLVLRSLGYFDDAENDPMPVMLQQLEWKETKGIIKRNLNNYLAL